MKSKYLLLFFCLVIGGTMSCDKNNQGVIPYIPVDIQININNPSYINLTAVGGWIYLDGGSMGIVVYRNSPDEFSAYDRHSSYEPDNNCQVEIDNSYLKLIDKCSGAEFLITDGSVIKGPASFPLQRYQTEFIDPILHIHN